MQPRDFPLQRQVFRQSCLRLLNRSPHRENDRLRSILQEAKLACKQVRKAVDEGIFQMHAKNQPQRGVERHRSLSREGKVRGLEEEIRKGDGSILNPKLPGAFGKIGLGKTAFPKKGRQG